MRAHDPRTDASALLPPGLEARVLEPSPPSNRDTEWFADDPTDPTGASGEVVTPIPGEGFRWADVDGSAAQAYAAGHWLDGRRRLSPLPPTFATTRDAIHQLAFFVLAPARYAATGKLGLRYTHGGLGTPFFGANQQLRVEAGTLVRQEGDQVEWLLPRSIGEAADFVGIEYRPTWFEGFHDPLVPLPPDAPLAIDPAAATALADWFGFATHVLERGRRTEGATDVSRVQLWPEHLDPAFEMGDQSSGRRASYGASAGDGGHPEPYLYVSAWGSIDRSDPYWNDETFNGASLPYGALLTAEDPYDAAIQFLTAGHRRLNP